MYGWDAALYGLTRAMSPGGRQMHANHRAQQPRDRSARVCGRLMYSGGRQKHANHSAL